MISLDIRAARWIALATLLLGVLLWAGPALLRADLFDDDAAQHIYWLYRYSDATLFPADLSIEYFRTSAPLGYRALYAVLAHDADALMVSKWVGVALMCLSGVLAWLIAQAIPGDDRELRGLFAVMAVVLFAVFTRNSGGIIWTTGFQRSFALPVMLLGLWGQCRRAHAVTGLSWIAAALFYPVVLPAMVIAAGTVLLADWRRRERILQPAILLAACGLAAALLALKGMPSAPSLGPAYSYAEAVAMPEFGPNGRLQLHGVGFSGDWLRFHMMGLGWPPLPLLGIIAAVLLATFAAPRTIPLPAWALLAAGMGLWGAMRLFPEQLMFGLYLPNRHARWAIAVFGIVAVSSASALCASWFWRSRPNSQGVWRLLRTGALLAAPAAVIVFLTPSALEQWRRPVDHHLENVYAWLESLPVETVVGAHPDLGDFIPLRSRRTVLSSTEESMPWMKAYYAQMKPRIKALLRAAYAPDMASMDAALRGFGVDVFVTGPPVWENRGYFEPYDAEVRRLQESGRVRGFALQAPPVDRVLFRSGDYYVLKVN